VISVRIASGVLIASTAAAGRQMRPCDRASDHPATAAVASEHLPSHPHEDVVGGITLSV
jgi:hypothetical protein